MQHFNAISVFAILSLVSTSAELRAQCSTTNSTSCACQTNGSTNCDLLPDIMISWQALQSASGGPSEYSLTDPVNAGRLRVTSATPNVGHGPLEVRGVDGLGFRRFICGTDTSVIFAPTNNTGFTCANGFNPRQILYQRIYHKNAGSMTYNDVQRGTMTYHSGHGHYHIDGWNTMTLRLAQPGITDPRQWPVIASGGKLGFCLINLFTCSGSPGYCRTSHQYNTGTTLLNTDFGNNYQLGDHWTGCGDDAQGIDVGKGDIYDESLQGMWINLLPGMCNGQYHIVADVDPNNDFLEENEDNNWTSIPFSLTLQGAANSGVSANITCSGRNLIAPGETRTLTASPGTAYSWSTGATTQSITVSVAGTYSCTVTCPCGSLSTPSLTLTALAAPLAPVGTGATINGPGTANLSATGNNLRWYTTAAGGASIGTGNSFTTPLINATTNYWVEDRSTSPGANVNAGKSTNVGGGGYSSVRQWTYFDANEPFTLESFKVYANSYGLRHFILADRLGNLIAEKYIELPAGLNTITLNWNVPVGVHHQITAYDEGATSSGTEVQIIDLAYNNAGVAYPYAIGTLGSITGASDGATNYYYLYDWVVKTPTVVALSPRTQVTATVVNQVAVNAKVKLEGPFDSNTGNMRDDLRIGALIPSTEPYTALGFTQIAGGGGEVLVGSPLTVTGNNAIVDWVRLELRSAITPSIVLATRQALVQRDGDVVASDGVSTVTFNVGSGSYYVAVRHRNHLGAMTSTAIALTAAPVAIDLSATTTGTWGVSARKQIGAVMVLWAGNTLLNSQISYTGLNNDRDPILVAIGGVIPTNTVVSYNSTDVNMDGVTKYTGATNDRDPILVNIGGNVPTNVLNEQLP
jgi:Ig-like domain CHU_C associated